MATKTKIVKLSFSDAKITVVSSQENKLAYGFRRTGRNTVAVATAICVDEDKFSHKTARELLVERFGYGYVMNLRIPADRYDNDATANVVANAMWFGNQNVD